MKSFQIVIPQYLPPAGYFVPFLESATVLIADHIQYKKRSSLTRSGLLKNNLQLTIPVKAKGFGQPICKKEITYIENWARKHLISLYHHYHMFPYFDEYYHKLQNIYENHHKYLNFFLFDLISLFTALLKIDNTLILTSQEEFSNRLDNSLIGFSKKNSNALFVYDSRDVKAGFINPDHFNNAKIRTKALPRNSISVPMSINIVEYLFTHGPEAAFKIREMK